jgi:hypothetical protein
MSQAAGAGTVDTTATAAAMSQAGASMAPEVFQAAYAAAFYAQQSRTAMMMAGLPTAPAPASHHHPSQAAAMMSALMGGTAPGMMPGMLPGMPMFPMPGMMMPQAEGAAGGGVGRMMIRGEQQQRGEGRVHRETMMSGGREMRRENSEKGERRVGGGKKQGRERRSARLERGDDADRGGGGGGKRERERGSGRERGRDKERGGSGSGDTADLSGDHGELLDADGRVRFTSLQEVVGQVSVGRSTASFPLRRVG